MRLACFWGTLGLAVTATAAVWGGASVRKPVTRPSRMAGKSTGDTLEWSDEFNGTAALSQPNPENWTYATGRSGWGNRELETYCAWGSKKGPCDPAQPNAYVGNDGYLHIVARSPEHGIYTSARLTSQGLQSFQYGRIEARIKVPRGQGMWPAFWLLGDDIGTSPWPACGEVDIMENIGKRPTVIYGSIHGTGFTGTILGSPYQLPDHAAFAEAFHTYGILWSPKKMEFYVDAPDNIYETRTPADLPPGAAWPFDDGKYFLLLNLAVGGGWPGPPDASTQFPKEMLVDWVRVYGR